MASTEFIGPAIGVAVGGILALVRERTRVLRARADCLKAARRAANEFYDAAEHLLAEPEVPERLKRALYDLTLAVTDKDAGPVAFNAVIEWVEETGNKQLPHVADPDLETLRDKRGDLYDEFLSAVRAALASLMFAYGPDHSKVAIEYEATRNQSIMLAVTKRLDRALSDWIAKGGEPSVSAEAVRA